MRYELTDHEWTAIKSFLLNKPRGVPRVNDRRVLNGIFWVLRSGAPWRDLPDNFGPYTTCYNRFLRWRRAGLSMIVHRRRSHWKPPPSKAFVPSSRSTHASHARSYAPRFASRRSTRTWRRHTNRVTRGSGRRDRPLRKKHAQHSRPIEQRQFVRT